MAAWPYCTALWQAIRTQVLSEEPLCRYCMEMGRVVAAEHVDHIKPVSAHPELAFIRSNLQGLCAHCHNSVKQREELRGGRIGSDTSGFPVDDSHHWING